MYLRETCWATEGDVPKGIQWSGCGVCGLCPLERLLVIGLWLIKGITLRFLLGSVNWSSFGPMGLSGAWFFLLLSNSSHSSFSSLAWSSTLPKSFTKEKQKEEKYNFLSTGNSYNLQLICIFLRKSKILFKPDGKPQN